MSRRSIHGIQDTTTLNYDGLRGATDLDGLGGRMGASGILAHFGVAVNEAGRPLGMFEANAAFRSAPDLDSARWIAGLDGALGFRAPARTTA